MKILLGFRTEHTNHGNDVSWSTSSNQVIDVIMKGQATALREYVRDKKEEIGRLEELSERLHGIIEGYIQPKSEKEVDELDSYITSLIQFEKYKPLLIIDAEEL